MGKLTIFKKKIDIDDEQNRLGPNNKVNEPKHHQLYFKTNPQNLLLKKILAPHRYQSDDSASIDSLKTSSVSSESHYRRKIAQNEAVM